MKPISDIGNPELFAGDLVNMQEQLFYYALQLTEDREDALDLVQETSYKALKNRTRRHNDDHIRAWLYTILKNTYINYLRSSHYRQLVHDTEELNQYSAQNGDQPESLPDELLMKKELHEIIKLLPGVYGKPIYMFLTGYSYKEISRQMDIPIGTVKSRIHLGKKQIRKVYTA
ncbi:MAG: sigma-70 family RNA polymerase sigma factor [Bacteroidales bacterium]|nr:sigma-70 family RNA polymerase sigma factor [Bacteroidales bacterium]